MTRKFYLFAALLFFVLLSACDDIREESYPDGKVHIRTPYVENKKQGVETEFYESGAVKASRRFENGKRQGETSEYYESGAIKANIPYTVDAIDGVVTRYYENGQTQSVTLYKSGTVVAFPQTFDAGGSPEIQGSYNDPRDGIRYEWVRIGDAVWTAENGKFAPVKGSVCMQCDIWGRLYDFESAKSACPASFRMPRIADWIALEKSAGKNPAKKLKSSFGWNDDGSGTDEFSFAVRASGAHFAPASVPTEKRRFKDAGEKAYFWTEEGTVAVFKKNSHTISFEKFNPEFGASLRCVIR